MTQVCTSGADLVASLPLSMAMGFKGFIEDTSIVQSQGLSPSINAVPDTQFLALLQETEGADPASKLSFVKTACTMRWRELP